MTITERRSLSYEENNPQRSIVSEPKEENTVKVLLVNGSPNQAGCT